MTHTPAEQRLITRAFTAWKLAIIFTGFLGAGICIAGIVGG